MATLGIDWIVFISIWAFVAMGYDKRQAKRKKSRVSEKNLWLLALIGGGIGAYFGMQVFRHKTLHTSFRVGFLMLALMDMAVILYLIGLRIPALSQLF
ncbi:DUF1294 domain-containing protein [Sporosarcina gallistercoris]|uniref:DUF1294 domain-containing protein n=1 Tax=Sporosarcina gallistercoris TaxID=2762245 RepID=A0ABR8PIH7_9BACL|nr:DUF1294 domain-containing protein [Sporosarcina gallistercoris]MBD7907960.1 DUF1294 domain-containing protein [Sporosarcina gallistercoris]